MEGDMGMEEERQLDWKKEGKGKERGENE